MHASISHKELKPCRTRKSQIFSVQLNWLMETHSKSLDPENKILMTELKRNKLLFIYRPSKATMAIQRPGLNVSLLLGNQTARNHKEYFTRCSCYLAAKTTYKAPEIQLAFHSEALGWPILPTLTKAIPVLKMKVPCPRNPLSLEQSKTVG